MAESLNGILLRRIRYSDTSLILTWFTDLRGKIKTMAKGAFRPKSGFAGKLDLFFHCDLLLSFSGRTELHLLREVSIKTGFEGIRKDYLKTSAASYFVELVEKVTELDNPAPELQGPVGQGSRQAVRCQRGGAQGGRNTGHRHAHRA